MLQLQLLEPERGVNLQSPDEYGPKNSLFTLRVKVYAANFSLDLVEAYVVEALEARTRYGAYSMVGN